MTDIRSKINDENNLIPDNVIAVVAQGNKFRTSVNEIVEPLAGNKKRDWFNSHFYYCLPLIIGNQYGFIIRSYYSWTAIWNGQTNNDAVTIEMENADQDPHQLVSSHFGSGIVTVQNRFHFRTAKGINLMTLNPPNFILENLQNLTGVIETDTLRRDFTFNLKITTPHKQIKIHKGQPIAAILPIPRYYVENFELRLDTELFSEDVISNERRMGAKFSHERQDLDLTKPHAAGRRYWNGEDADGNKFDDHQIKIRKK
jgi:hypothetical protein